MGKQEHATVGHITSAVRKQRATDADGGYSFCPCPENRKWCPPQSEWVFYCHQTSLEIQPQMQPEVCSLHNVKANKMTERFTTTTLFVG